MDSDNKVKKYVSHLTVMLHGVADITEDGQALRVHVEPTANQLMPSVFSVGTEGPADDNGPSDEAKLMFLLGVVREWHRKIEKLVREKCKNVSVNDAVDVGNGQTGLVGDGGAKA